MINDVKQFIKSKNFLQAEKLCYKIIADSPDHQQAHFFLATIKMLQNQDKVALEYLDKAIASGPQQLDILFLYGRILRRQSKPALAIDKLKAGLTISRTKVVLLELGQAYIENSEIDKAEDIFKETLKLDNNCLTSLQHLGRITLTDNRINEFIKYSEQMRKLNPTDFPLAMSLIMTYLGNSEHKKALSLCNNTLTIHPSKVPLYAMKYIALAESGESAAASEIMHFDSLLNRFKAKCPETYTNIGALNKELVHHAKNHAMKATNPERYTTQFGWQTESGKLFEQNTELGKTIERLITNTVQEYISALPEDANHPVNLTRPKEFTYESWIVVLNTNGHQAPHIHPGAWLGGVYYVKLPEDFDSQATPDAGHIVFGKGQEGLHNTDSPDTVTLKPVEGDLIIFPAYFWHHTIPLESDSERICLAFNVIEKK